MRGCCLDEEQDGKFSLLLTETLHMERGVIVLLSFLSVVSFKTGTFKHKHDTVFTLLNLLKSTNSFSLCINNK